MEIINETHGSRLSWNSNGWKYPSGCDGKCYGSGNEPSNFECSHGFGFEEWLFNEKFQCEATDGHIYQYGFIQCFHNNKSKQNHLFEEFLLWTRKCEGCCDEKNNGDFYYVGTIKDLEVLDFNFDFRKIDCLVNPIEYVTNTYKMDKELKGKLKDEENPGQDDSRFFNVRFKVNENKSIYDNVSNNIAENCNKIKKIGLNRFLCYKLDAYKVNNIKGNPTH